MICDFRWCPNRYEFEWKLIPDNKTRCGRLFLHKKAEVNCLGETREEVEAENCGGFNLLPCLRVKGVNISGINANCP